MQRHLHVALVLASLYACTALHAQPLTDRLIYTRYTPPNGSVWLNDGNGTDSVFFSSGNLAKLMRDGKHILYMQNTAWNNPAWQGNMARYNAFDGSTNTLAQSSDYLVGYDMLFSDSAMVYSYSCAIYHVNWSNQIINTVSSASCYDDGPDIDQMDSLIAFHNVQQSLFTVHLDGTQRTAIPNTVQYDMWPTWSSDGQWLLFGRSNSLYTDYGGNVVNFFKIKANGDSLTAITTNAPTDTAFYHSNAVWSADGEAIITSGRRNGQNTLIAIRADGSGLEMELPTTPGDSIQLISGTADVHVTAALVQEQAARRALKLWPVPATDRLHVHPPATMSQWQLRLIDMQGRTVLRSNASGVELEADISALSPGAYQALAVGSNGARIGVGRVLVVR